jgi:hypothetical protein
MNSGDFAGAVAGGIFFICVAVTFILRGPLGKALARRIEGTSSPVEDRVQYLEHRVAELGEAQSRIPELEERLDFAERLLTQQTVQAQRVSPGEQR